MRHAVAGSAPHTAAGQRSRANALGDACPADQDLPVTLRSAAGSANVRRLRALVRGLWPRASLLAQDVIRAIEQNHPPYRDHVRQHRAVREIEQTVRIALLAVPAPETCDDTMHRWTGYGEASARAGLPLDMVLTCHRISSATLWSALTQAAKAGTRPTIEALLGASIAWWRIQDLQAAAIASSYHAVAAALSEPQAAHVNATLDALLDGRVAQHALAAAAAALDVPVHGPYLVAIAERASELAAQPRVETDGPVGVRRVFWRRQPRGDIAVLLLATSEPERLDGLFRRTADVRIGISPLVADLGQLDRARRLAYAAVRTCAVSGDVAVLDERLPTALVAAAPEVADRAVEHVLGPLLALDPRQRDMLLTTAAVWLDSGGSTDIASRRLYCHRNTVLNRLRRIEQLCHCSLFDQQSPLQFAIALEAYRFLGQPTGTSDGGEA